MKHRSKWSTRGASEQEGGGSRRGDTRRSEELKRTRAQDSRERRAEKEHQPLTGRSERMTGLKEAIRAGKRLLGTLVEDG